MIYCPHCSKPSTGKTPKCPHCGGELPKIEKKREVDEKEKLALDETKVQTSLSRREVEQKKPEEGNLNSTVSRSKTEKIVPTAKEEREDKRPRIKFAKPISAKKAETESKRSVQNKILIGEILMRAKVLKKEQLEEALERQEGSGQKLGAILVDNNYITETQLVQALSYQTGIRWIDIEAQNVRIGSLDLVPLELAQKNAFVPIEFGDKEAGAGKLFLAMDDPLNSEVIGEVETAIRKPVEPLFALPSAIKRALESSAPVVESEQKNEVMAEVEPQDKGVSGDDEWSLPTASNRAKPDLEKTPLAKVEIVKKPVALAATDLESSSELEGQVLSEIVVEEKTEDLPDSQNVDVQQELETDSDQPGDDVSFDDVQLSNVQFVDRATSERTALTRDSFLEHDDIQTRLLRELEQLDESPAGILRLKQYVRAILKVLLESGQITPSEIEEELYRAKSESTE